ncbi:uncharacterized protein CTRU02_206463 [Colletotrichum truncatum]|uniref:Uncharacterized protein n=1 Tax=Colletotrichum truncatum TaxID=5467 RepID=A0ACC3Z6X2_COLTU
MNRIREFENEEDSDKEPEYQHDPLTEQQILREDSPYDSDEPRDVACQRAQTEIAYGLTPSVDDTSSEEEPEKDNTPERIAHKQVNQHNDKQFIELYSMPNIGPRTHYTPQLRIEDHPYLRITDPSHRYLFWAQCFFDYYETHIGEKYEHHFQPRKYDNTPLRNVYTAHTLTGWELRKFDGNIATFTPSRQYPIRRIKPPEAPIPGKSPHEGTTRREAHHLPKTTKAVKKLDSPTDKGPRQATTTRSICLAFLDQKVHLQLAVTINDTTTIALIDSGAEMNFISPQAVNRLRLPWQKKEYTYQLSNIEGEQV